MKFWHRGKGSSQTTIYLWETFHDNLETYSGTYVPMDKFIMNIDHIIEYRTHLSALHLVHSPALTISTENIPAY